MMTLCCLCVLLVSLTANELLPMVIPESEVKKQRYRIPKDW